MNGFWSALLPPPEVIKTRERRDVSRLVRALKHADAYEREWAARALGELRAVEAVGPLTRVVDMDPGSTVGRSIRAAAAVSLGKIGDARAIPILGKLLATGASDEAEQAATALGNIHHLDAVATLIRGLGSGSWTVRKATVIALSASGEQQALEPLMNLVKSEPVEGVAEVAVNAVGAIGNRRVTDFLLTTLVDDDRYGLQQAAMQGLAEMGGPQVEAEMLDIFHAGGPRIRQRLQSTRQDSEGKAPEERAAQLFRDAEWISNLRARAAEALGKMKCWAALESLIAELDELNGDEIVQSGAARGLGHLGHPSAIGVLTKVIETFEGPDSSDVRCAAAAALGKLSNPDAVVALTERLARSGEDAQVLEREAIVRALGEIGHAAGFKAVKSALQDASLRVRMSAVQGMTRFKHHPEAVESLISIVAYRLSPEASAAVSEWAKGSSARDLSDAPRIPKNVPDDAMMALAAKALGEIGDARAIPPLVEAISGSNSFSVQGEAAIALGRLRAREAVNGLMSILHSDTLHQYLGAPVAEALGRISDPKAIPALQDALRSLNWGTHRAAAKALDMLGHPPSTGYRG